VAKKYLNSPQPKIIPYKQDPRIVPNHQNKLVKIRAQNEFLAKELKQMEQDFSNQKKKIEQQ
jgi:hypothetical protein